MSLYSVDKLISETRRLAAEYRRSTGAVLPVTAEIARHDVARLLGFELVPVAAEGGYDAIGTGRWAGERIQIKGRTLFDEGKASPRIGQFKTHQEWDVVMLLLLDEDYEPMEIYALERADVEAETAARGGARAKRGAISVAKFKIIGERVWSREHGVEDDGYWDNSLPL
ncbi:MAG: hypothetical protein U5S82_01020 [Gammaproteobacteria bacterium]|nr:hypothetical protein [Gammaproteobacteria bacterium]